MRDDDDMGGILACGQCSKPSIAQVNRVPLCVDCYHKTEVARTLAFCVQAIGLNHAIDEIDRIAPWGPPSPRMQVPDIPEGPIILNNIQVDNSIVGSINTGNVASIDVSITSLRIAGAEKISAALKELTEAIANDRTVSKSDKDHLLDQVAFLSEQAVIDAKGRRPGMIGAALGAVGQVATTVSAIANAWNVAEPLLRNYFGIG